MHKQRFEKNPVLIVPGLYGSGPDHWQSHWQKQHPSWQRVTQDNWSLPDLDTWAERLCDALVAAPGPVLIAAHSFGCLVTAKVAAQYPRHIAGALLVAPANPQKFGVVGRLPHQPLGFPSRIVASDNDPWMSLEIAREWAARWGSALTVLRGAGHINAESGLGDWAAGLDLLNRIVANTFPMANDSGRMAIATGYY
jgi:predicted alpha/beta hydrolase family esterase